MNVQQQKTALKRYGFDDSDPLLTWLNAAMHEIEGAYSWPWLETKFTVSGAIGDSAIVLPSSAFKVISIRDMSTFRKLERYDRTRFEREINDPTSTGTPSVYCLTDMTTVQIWPVLDRVINWQVFYQMELQDLVNDTDVPQIPTRMHYTMVRGGAFIALQAENEEDRSRTAQAAFASDVQANMAIYGFDNLDEPDQVTDVMGYGSDWGDLRYVP